GPSRKAPGSSATQSEAPTGRRRSHTSGSGRVRGSWGKGTLAAGGRQSWSVAASAARRSGGFCASLQAPPSNRIEADPFLDQVRIQELLGRHDGRVPGEFLVIAGIFRNPRFL